MILILKRVELPTSTQFQFSISIFKPLLHSIAILFFSEFSIDFFFTFIFYPSTPGAFERQVLGTEQTVTIKS